MPLQTGRKCVTLSTAAKHRPYYFSQQEEIAMNPTVYTVLDIAGDYADLRSDGGVDNRVAMFLLPEGLAVGDRLLWENFEWSLLREGPMC